MRVTREGTVLSEEADEAREFEGCEEGGEGGGEEQEVVQGAGRAAASRHGQPQTWRGHHGLVEAGQSRGTEAKSSGGQQ